MKRNKKLTAVISASILVIAIIGTTFAWWTARTSTKTDITMGALKIEASFEELDADVYEPGQTVEINGIIKNTGSIPAVMHIQNDTQIKFTYADDDLNEWTGLTWVEDTEGAVIASLDGNEAIKWDESGSVLWAWLYNLEDVNDRYLVLPAGNEVEVTVEYECVGSVMTNKYMDALIRAKSDIDATQTYDAAMQDMFGIDYDDLGMAADLEPSRSLVPESVIRQIREIFHQ